MSIAIFSQKHNGRWSLETTSAACCTCRSCKPTAALGDSWPCQWLQLHHKHTHFFLNECETNFSLLETWNAPERKEARSYFTLHLSVFIKESYVGLSRCEEVERPASAQPNTSAHRNVGLKISTKTAKQTVITFMYRCFVIIWWSFNAIGISQDLERNVSCVICITALTCKKESAVCSTLPFLFPLLLYCFLSMLSVFVCGDGGGGSCFQGDENTRIQAAATVLCNRAVTSMMYKRLVERRRGERRLTETKNEHPYKRCST